MNEEEDMLAKSAAAKTALGVLGIRVSCLMCMSFRSRTDAFGNPLIECLSGGYRVDMEKDHTYEIIDPRNPKLIHATSIAQTCDRFRLSQVHTIFDSPMGGGD